MVTPPTVQNLTACASAGALPMDNARRSRRRCSSRRISEEHRLVYLVDGDDLVILQARFHYK
jgi:Txe/YoeB family toxin of Txe-Axe toxin-antitoxin module